MSESTGISFGKKFLGGLLLLVTLGAAIGLGFLSFYFNTARGNTSVSNSGDRTENIDLDDVFKFRSPTIFEYDIQGVKEGSEYVDIGKVTIPLSIVVKDGAEKLVDDGKLIFTVDLSLKNDYIDLVKDYASGASYLIGSTSTPASSTKKNGSTYSATYTLAESLLTGDTLSMSLIYSFDFSSVTDFETEVCNKLADHELSVGISVSTPD